MPAFTVRLAKLEQLDRFAREQSQPWIPPSREGVAALLAHIMPRYADCGLVTGPVLDEEGIAAALAAMPWPEVTSEPASLQGFRLLSEALRRCGVSTEAPI